MTDQNIIYRRFTGFYVTRDQSADVTIIETATGSQLTIQGAFQHEQLKLLVDWLEYNKKLGLFWNGKQSTMEPWSD